MSGKLGLSNKLLQQFLTGKIKNQERFVRRLKSTLTKQEQALNSAIEQLKAAETSLGELPNIEVITNELPFSAERYCDNCTEKFNWGLEETHHSDLTYGLDICEPCYLKLREMEE